MNFIAMDFETANHEKHSACSIALVMVKNSKIVGRYYSLIKPDTNFSWRNIQVHGIHPEDVQHAPSFPQVWEEIKEYFQPNHLIIAHNVAFDRGVLQGCLSYYNLAPAHFLTLCTVRSSRKLFPTMPNHKLNTVCRELNITLNHHHDALEDSVACAEILLHQEKQFGTETLKQLVQSV